MPTSIRPLEAFSTASLYILMYSCWLSLKVAVPNFMVNSAASVADGPMASASATPAMRHPVRRVKSLMNPPLDCL